MSKTFYPIPDEIDPVDKICVRIRVPHNDGHIGAFLGAIYNLTKWYSWERDDNQSGKQLGAVWTGVFDEMVTNLYQGCDDMNFRQEGCNLEALIQGVWTVIYQLSDACVTEKVKTGIENGSINPPIRGGGDSRTIDPATEQSTSQSDLDRVWGACLELHESVFDLCRILCDILEAAGDALSALGNLLESPVSSVTEWVADDITGVQKNWSTTGQSKWDTTGGVRTYERTITDPIRAITPSRLLTILQRGIDIGVSILRNSLNEDFQEACAGLLFNRLTCLPNGERKTTGIVLTSAILAEHGDELVNDADLIKKFIGTAIKADEIVDAIGFLSLLNLPDLFRQYNIGALQPNNTWTVTVEACELPDEPWIETIYLGDADPYGFEGLSPTGRSINPTFGGFVTGFINSPRTERLDMRRLFPQPTNIVKWRVFVNANAVFNANGYTLDSGWVGTDRQNMGNADFTNEWLPYHMTDAIVGGILFSCVQTSPTPPSGANQLRVQQIEIHGIGYNPFAV